MPFELGHQVFGEAQVLESLRQDLGGMLCLAAITGEALLRLQATALSGFGLFFGVSFRWGHDALLDSEWVCGGGSLSKCTCHMPPRVGENEVILRHVLPGLPAFFYQPYAV
jgi:hypothetical protein